MKLCKSILRFSQDLCLWTFIKLQGTKRYKIPKAKPPWGGWVQLFDANPRHSLTFPSSPRKHTGVIIHQDIFPLCNLYTAMLVDVFDVFGRCFPHQATKAQIKGTKPKPLWGGWVQLFDANPRLPFIPTETHWLEWVSIKIYFLLKQAWLRFRRFFQG